jgi:hypothetical protein
MTLTNAVLIFDEYPFLKNIRPLSLIQNAQVKRWNREFIESYPHSYPDSGREKIFLLDDFGRFIGQVSSLWARIWLNGREETVGQRILRLAPKDRGRIKYAVSFWGGEITLWKLPNEFRYSNGGEYFESLVKADREKIQNA